MLEVVQLGDGGGQHHQVYTLHLQGSQLQEGTRLKPQAAHGRAKLGGGFHTGARGQDELLQACKVKGAKVRHRPITVCMQGTCFQGDHPWTNRSSKDQSLGSKLQVSSSYVASQNPSQVCKKTMGMELVQLLLIEKILVNV